MKRVHRDLTRDDIEALREELAALVPQQEAGIPQILRLMRLIARKSQVEYAQLCGVAPALVARIERGTAAPTTATLEKLIRPFGLTVGIVSPRPQASLEKVPPTPTPATAGNPKV